MALDTATRMNTSSHPQPAPLATKGLGRGWAAAGLLFVCLFAGALFYLSGTTDYQGEEQKPPTAATPSSPPSPPATTTAGAPERPSALLSTTGQEAPSVLPADLAALPAAQRKAIFLRLLQPVVMQALEEIAQERRRLLALTARAGLAPADRVPEPLQLLALGATVEEAEFLARLGRKYRARTIGDLLARVNVLPPSLILAQGAIESSWGTSRFAQEGNNLFGVWTWSADGIIPIRRDPDKNHRVARYRSILDSVRAYLLNLNRHPAYAMLRELRQQTFDPFVLVQGLEPYSARGAAYIEEVKAIIAANDLHLYDRQMPLITAIFSQDEDLTAL